MAKYQVTQRSNLKISSSLSTQNLIDSILKSRDIVNPQNFCHPPDPSQLLASDFDLDPSILRLVVEKVNTAIANQDGILIYGDYDVDGITATAILYKALVKLKAKVLPFLPHRHLDGYGLKYQAVSRYLAEKKFPAKLIITVDNGISAKAEISKLQQAGFEVIVTDHHEKGSAVPKDCLILHTVKTSGAGISWFLSNQLTPGIPLDLASLGIVADCLPLLDVNRTLVIQGLKDINQTRNLGLKKLIEISNISGKNIDTYHLSFLLAPRLNASGRLDDATNSLRLLCATTEDQASNFSRLLNEQNLARQELQQVSHALAVSKLTLGKSQLLLVADQSFNPGIIGLIAGKLTEANYLPSIVISQMGAVYKGSCRSIPELNITECLEECRDLCLDLGGHSQAAGFSLLPENYEKFIKKIREVVNQKLLGQILTPKLIVDGTMDIQAVNLSNCQAIQTLSPFGIGFPEPTFLFENVEVLETKILGSERQHLKFILSGNVEALAFSAEKDYFTIQSGNSISFVAKLSENTFNNFTRPQLLLKYISSVNGRSL